MVIVIKKAIHLYATKNTQSTEALNDWFLKTKEADWSCFADVRTTFNSVNYVGNDNYVFNIKGSHYQLIARIIFPVRTVFIRFIGSYTEYEKIDASTV